MELLLGILIIIICILGEGFFAGTETALVSVDKTHIKALKEKGDKKASLVDKALNHPERFFSTTLLGTNLCTVTSNTIVAFFVIKYLGQGYEYITVLIMTPLILLFAETIPKTIYRYHADILVFYIVYPIKIISYVFSPFIEVLSRITVLLLRLIGLKSSNLKTYTTREDIENYLAMWNITSGMRTAEKKMIERVFDFTQTTAEDVMVRLINIEAIEVNDSFEKAINAVRKTGYSRIPVYGGEVYNIVGIVHAFDLLRTEDGHQNSITELMRAPRYVPNSMPVDELLKQMRTQGISIVVVVNEYGGTTGIVTIEDILEEIVGEIYDEYDKKETVFLKTGRNKYLVKGQVEIDELNEHLEIKLPTGDYETLAGFLLKQMEKIPEEGESIKHENIRLTITHADQRSVKEVLLEFFENSNDSDMK